jgi:hypothetical protein
MPTRGSRSRPTKPETQGIKPEISFRPDHRDVLPTEKGLGSRRGATATMVGGMDCSDSLDKVVALRIWRYDRLPAGSAVKPPQKPLANTIDSR